jgi:hypothetical protein
MPIVSKFPKTPFHEQVALLILVTGERFPSIEHIGRDSGNLIPVTL